MKKTILIPILIFIRIRYKNSPKTAEKQYKIVMRLVKECEYFKGYRSYWYRQIVKFKNKGVKK